MGSGKLTLRCDQGASFRVQARWRAPLLDPASGDPILDVDGQVQPGPPVSLTGYTGRMQVRKTLASTEVDLELTTENTGILIAQQFASLLGWCRLATEADVPFEGLVAVDGVMPVEGDRILVKAQSAPGDNGVYIASAGPWVRAADADTPADLSAGQAVWVREGVRNDDTTWRQGNTVTSVGDPQTWVRTDNIGVFELKATDEQTAELTSSGVYDVELISQGGEVTRVLEGKFRLSKEVTRTG